MAKRGGLPKSIIRKYGITKKAWSVFRGGKKHDPGRSVSRGSKGGYYFTSRTGKKRYDPPKYGRARSAAGRLRKFLAPAIGTIATIEQATHQDRETYLNFATLPALEKAKFIVGRLVGRASYGMFDPLGVGAPKPELNIANCFNKWTGIGVVGLVYSWLPLRLPFKSYAKSIGKGAIAGGIVGGLLDEATPTQPGSRVMVTQAPYTAQSSFWSR